MMLKKRRASRPTLNEVDPDETALIWNPQHGFRLMSPERGPNGELSLPETFLTVLAMRITEELMNQMTGEYLAHFRKH